MDIFMSSIGVTSSVKGSKCLDWFMFIYKGKNIVAINTLLEVFSPQCIESNLVPTLKTFLSIYWNIN